MPKTTNKRKRLVQAAEKLFAQYGYRKVSIDEIVQNAGVAKGTFYLYFKNKDELYTHIIEHYYQKEIIAPVKECAEQEKDLRKRIYFDFITGIAYFRHRKILREIMLQNPNYFSENVTLETLLQKNIELMNILFARDSDKIRSDISLKEIAKIYALQVDLAFREKDEKHFWKQVENLAVIFIDGILSPHRWTKKPSSASILRKLKAKSIL